MRSSKRFVLDWVDSQVSIPSAETACAGITTKVTGYSLMEHKDMIGSTLAVGSKAYPRCLVAYA